ncbi:ORF1228 [White spot syndrome virus]|uniref:ORF1228 n=1 Tax=White spot syndrome virus TaxID=342409 RepID=A0A2D3I6C3_9VIRU|nr:ORF1228 [White spot syndrome virus]
MYREEPHCRNRCLPFYRNKTEHFFWYFKSNNISNRENARHSFNQIEGNFWGSSTHSWKKVFNQSQMFYYFCRLF